MHSDRIQPTYITKKFPRVVFASGMHNFTLWLYGRQPVKAFKTLNDRQSGIFNKFDLSAKNPNLSKLSYVD